MFSGSEKRTKTSYQDFYIGWCYLLYYGGAHQGFATFLGFWGHSLKLLIQSKSAGWHLELVPAFL